MTSTKKKGQRQMSVKMKKIKSEGAVQETPFNYFPQPQTKDLGLFI